MDTEQILYRLFAGHLTEGLPIEFKQVIEIATHDGVRKLVCGLFALRNYGGGHFIIGVKRDGTVSTPIECPTDRLREISTDAVHRLIHTYASEVFPVEVTFRPDGTNPTVVCIAVPGGVRTPVAVKADRKDGANFVLREGTVFYRCLANGMPSSAVIPWRSWPDQIQTCFDNREAEIGGLLRRTFGEKTLDEIRSVLCGPTRDQEAPPDTQPQPPIPQSRDASLGNVHQFLEAQAARSGEAIREKGGDPTAYGSHSTGAIVVPAVADRQANLPFLNTVMSSNPSYTGFPAWVDSRSFSNPDERPYVIDDGWEAVIRSGWADVTPNEFWRIEPSGKFFLRTAYQDDVDDHERKPTPRTQLDFGLVILRIAERIEVVKAMLRALDARPTSRVFYTFKFDSLRGRTLSNWANPERYISARNAARQDTVTADFDLQLDAPLQTTVEGTHIVANSVFRLFDGFELSRKVTEDLVTRLVQRRL